MGTKQINKCYSDRFRYIHAYSCIIRHIQGLFRYNQTYSGSCVILVYSEPWHIQKPGVFRGRGILRSLSNIHDGTFFENVNFTDVIIFTNHNCCNISFSRPLLYEINIYFLIQVSFLLLKYLCVAWFYKVNQMVNKDLNVELSCLSTVKMMFTKLLLGKEMEDAGSRQ